MHVAYCFDEKYKQHFAVALCSLIKNIAPCTHVTIHIVTPEPNTEFKEKIISFVKSEFFHINWIDFDIAKVQNLPIAANTHFSSAIYFRLFLPYLLPNEVEKVIYLDSDTICITDISELQAIDTSTSLVAGVLDLKSESESIRLGVKNYINSGVLVINLLKWREQKISEKCFEWLQKNSDSILGDQDAINFVCQSNLKLLDEAWNVCINPCEIKTPSDIKIIHYITHMKPWQLWYDDELASSYDYYLNLTPWSNTPKQAPETVNQWMLFARKMHNQKSYEKSAQIYENIIQKLLEKIQ